ncbi:MAG TPA: adenylate/guanylate cyclase domain-containing protein [Marmoricola sp.]
MDGRLYTELLPSTAVGALAICVGLGFLVVQQRTLATMGMSGAWTLGGLAMVLVPGHVDTVDTGDEAVAARAVSLLVVATFVCSGVYIAGLLRTARTSRRAERFVLGAVILNFALSALMAVLFVLNPEAAMNDFGLGLDDPDSLTRPGFWLFGAPFLAAGGALALSWGVLARQRLDVGERTRANTSAVAVVFLMAAVVTPYRLAVASFVAAEITMLLGLFRFHVAQGERGVFLSRFLSSQVAEQVRAKGLTSVMEPAEVELTVVACDLRGFTSYAEGVPSQAVIDLLGEYYDAVGDAVAEVDGTIKDYAGDGILILIGAPLPRTDHATAGLTLSRRIHEVTRPVLDRWSTTPHPLGIGVGAATGRVTVGAIGSSGRMEYTAVGTPVNLAARLCSTAQAGETLVDSTLADAVGRASLRALESVPLKGFGDEVPVFAV